MASVICRNTFLEVADEGSATTSQQLGGASKQRARSADSVRGSSKPPEETTDEMVEFQLVRLNQLLENGPASPERKSKETTTSLSELMQLQKKLQQALVPSKMTNVLSNNSISTMCSISEDDFELPDGEEESSTPMSRKSLRSKLSIQCTPSSPESAKAPFNKVPRSLDLAAEYERSTDTTVPKTTIMIRNIPNRYSQRELLLELEENGFADTFDFLYIPMDKCTRANLGYAFVNFKEPDYAEKCMGEFQNYRFKRHRDVSQKIAAISVAHIQGLEANLSHYANSVVNSSRHKQRRPVVLAKVPNPMKS